MNQSKPPMTDGPAIVQARSEMTESTQNDEGFPFVHADQSHEVHTFAIDDKYEHSLRQAAQVVALGGMMVAGAVGGAAYAGFGFARSGYDRLRSSSQRLVHEASIAVGAQEPQPLPNERQSEQG